MKRKNISQLTTLGISLVALGTIFNLDKLVSNSFIGAGEVASIISLIKLKKKLKK